MARRRPLVVSVSGPDGSGKSTQIERLVASLARGGNRPKVLWSRLGYTPLFEATKAVARRLLRRRLPQRGAPRQHRDEMMGKSQVRTLWLAVATCDLVFTYAILVRLYGLLGRPVVCDRYIWDALIDRAMYYPDQPWVDAALTRAFGLLGRRPDLALLLHLPLEEALARSVAKDEPFPDAASLRRRRHEAYAALAEDQDLETIDARESVDRVAGEIAGLLGARR